MIATLDEESALVTLTLSLLLGSVTALIATAILFAGWLSSRTRRLLGFAAITCGLALLIGAATADGARSTRLRALFLHHHCVVDEPSAPAAQLPRILGIVALAGGFLALRAKPSRSLSLTTPIVIASAIAVLRFGVDRAAAPEALAHAFGVTWLVPVLGAYVAMRVATGASPSFSGDLAILAIATRIPALALNAITTAFDLGSHYSLVRVARIAIPFARDPLVFEPRSLSQFFALSALPQLVVWPIITFAVAGVCARILLRNRLSAESLARSPL